ncbi:hypothetical protein ACS2Q8_25805 [Bacillus cereus group sp. Bce007]|uniref:hypothetical protein n=1 Tax=Bacillus cereus group sp. Bce007 TaxID=3445254 RepID=UPI003F29DE21
MKEFIIEIESINGKIHTHVGQYEEVSVDALKDYIRTDTSRLFQFGDTLINLDNVFSIKVSEKTTKDNKNLYEHAHNIQLPPPNFRGK